MSIGVFMKKWKLPISPVSAGEAIDVLVPKLNLVPTTILLGVFSNPLIISVASTPEAAVY